LRLKIIISKCRRIAVSTDRLLRPTVGLIVDADFTTILWLVLRRKADETEEGRLYYLR
jgi:hypothetical protein